MAGPCLRSPFRPSRLHSSAMGGGVPGPRRRPGKGGGPGPVLEPLGKDHGRQEDASVPLAEVAYRRRAGGAGPGTGLGPRRRPYRPGTPSGPRATPVRRLSRRGRRGGAVRLEARKGATTRRSRSAQDSHPPPPASLPAGALGFWESLPPSRTSFSVAHASPTRESTPQSFRGSSQTLSPCRPRFRLYSRHSLPSALLHSDVGAGAFLTLKADLRHLRVPSFANRRSVSGRGRRRGRGSRDPKGPWTGPSPNSRHRSGRERTVGVDRCTGRLGGSRGDFYPDCRRWSVSGVARVGRRKEGLS